MVDDISVNDNIVVKLFVGSDEMPTVSPVENVETPCNPQLLRIPDQLRTVTQALNCADKLDLTNVLILSQRENGSIVFLTDHEMTMANANWLLDNAKQLILNPDRFQVSNEGPVTA